MAEIYNSIRSLFPVLMNHPFKLSAKLNILVQIGLELLLTSGQQELLGKFDIQISDSSYLINIPGNIGGDWQPIKSNICPVMQLEYWNTHVWQL